MKVLSGTVIAPKRLEMPPPIAMAELLVNVQPLIVSVSALCDAAALAGGVAGEGAAADRQRPECCRCRRRRWRCSGEGAVGDRAVPQEVVEAAASSGGVAGEGAVAHRQRPAEVFDAAAVAARSCR